MRVPSACALLLTGLHAGAQPWDFAPPLTLAADGAGRFHHLDSAGRHNVAVSGDLVAVAWEDDRDGTPRVYLARKRLDAAAFGETLPVSGPGEAYEPSLAPLGGGRFALAWEEDGQVRARLAHPDGLGPMTALSREGGAQVSLSAYRGDLLAVWAEPAGRFNRVVLSRPRPADGGGLLPGAVCPVDPLPVADDQLYPAAAAAGAEWVVAWEDRRPGHTIIMAAAAPAGTAGGACPGFGPPRRISAGGGGPGMPYGKGHGVSRVVLAEFGAGALLAAWEDKRDFRHGYDVYGALRPAGGNGFGPNLRIQDDFGELARQRHVSVAGDAAGRLAAAWSDEREGTADVLLSWYGDDGWSDDTPLPGAAGPGEQSNPSIALDAAGNLHAAWVERAVKEGPTRIRYAFGRASGDR